MSNKLGIGLTIDHDVLTAVDKYMADNGMTNRSLAIEELVQKALLEDGKEIPTVISNSLKTISNELKTISMFLKARREQTPKDDVVGD